MLTRRCDPAIFEDYLARWHLIREGDPIGTRNSRLLPVRLGNLPAMLKVSTEPEEIFGAALMLWWNGRGAARVLAQDGRALLLERAQGKCSLADFARNGRDGDATRIICTAVAKLHEPGEKPLPELVPLPQWFRALELAAAALGGILGPCAATASALLAAPRDVGPLHGDIHHGNVLDFGSRGWLAIDPKGLIGERGFDYANLFCNPDDAVATAPGRFRERVAIVAEASSLERTRLLRWILAWAGLSAAWSIEDGLSPRTAMRVAQLAFAELGR